MGRIIIRDPDFVDDYCWPHPKGIYGVERLSYLGTGISVSATRAQSPNVTPEQVREVLLRLQETCPLGAVGEFEVLLTGRQLFPYDDPASGLADGVRQPGWIGLAGRVHQDLDDLLGHELAHELATRLSAVQVEYIWRELGQEEGDNRHVLWEKRPQERLAEYLSAALWDLPIDERVLRYNDPDPSPQTLARLRDLVMPIFSAYGRARVTIGDVPLFEITIGSTTAIVDGREVQLDVPAQIIDGRAMVPVRFVSEALGRRVDYEPKPGPVRRVLIY